jgi:hypothetical protein
LDAEDVLESLPAVAAVRGLLARAASGRDGVAGALDVVGDMLSWRVGALWVPESPEAGAALRACCTWRARSHPHTDFERITRELRLQAGEGLPGRVWTGDAPLSISDVAADANFPRHAVAALEGLHAAVAFPVPGRGRRHGVVEFFSDRVRIPTGSLLPAFARIGRELGAFLDDHPLSPFDEAPPCTES